MQPQQFEGYWTLAGSDTQVPGRLTFSPEHGVVLTLNGAFDSDDPFRVDDSYYTIHGVTAANRRVTLVRCLRRTSVMASGYSTAEYSSPGMVIGCHFPSDEAMKFKQLSVSYYNQEEIFGESGIREELTVAAPGTVDITLSYKKPDPLRAQLGDFLIETRYAWGVEGDRWEGRRIRQRAWLTASSDGGRHLNDFLGGPMRSLHTLMELAADAALPIEGIVGIAAVGDVEEEDVEVFIQPPRHVLPPKRRHPRELLFTFYGLGDRFADCVQRWHAGRERYGPTFDLFFALGSMSLFLEHQFLSLIQAIEAYHRRAFHNHALDPEEHSRRVKLVTDSLARDDRVSDIEKAWVESKIRYNEPSLVERLTQLYDKLPSKAQGVLGGRERFARTVADTRHYMTHWDERQRARALTGAELLLGIQQLRLVIKLVFLGELGLATDEMIGRLREPRHIEKLLR